MHFSILSKSRKSSQKSKSQTKSNKYLSKAQIALIITTLSAIIVLYGMKDQTNVVYTTAVYMLKTIKSTKVLLWHSELGQKIIGFVRTHNPWHSKISLTPEHLVMFDVLQLPATADLSDLKNYYAMYKSQFATHPEMLVYLKDVYTGLKQYIINK